VVVRVLTVVVGYFLGTVPTALLVGRRAGIDPRRSGSGNPGASNVYRTVGRRAAAVVLGGDVVKGAVAAGLGWALGGHTLGLVAGGAAVVGHSFPVGRRGGKGVATCAGMLLVVFPVAAAGAALGWIAVARVAHRPSVASIVLAAGLPAGLVLAGAPGAEVALLAAVAALVVLRHAGNIRRLVRGAELPIEVAGP
jgi:glycerol-3-phosphate acyltransferase PlsY